MVLVISLRHLIVSIVVALLAFVVITQGEQSQFSSLQELTQNVSKGLFNVENLPSSLNSSEFPNIEEGEQQLKAKCEKNGGNTSYADFLVAKDEVQTCIKGLVNYTEFQLEVEEAKPHGDLEKVFRKYCLKSPILKACISNFTDAIEPCLEESEKALKNTVHNVTEALLNFICYKEGDKIALFIAEGGTTCMSEKNEGIQSCLNSTFRKYVPNELGEESLLPLLKLGESECQDVFELQKCLVGKLEKCEEPTPANIIDSLFNFVYKQTPCQNVKPKTTSTETSAASNLHVFIHLLVLIFSVHLWS